MKKILQITALVLLLLVFLTPTALAAIQTQTVNFTIGQNTVQINGETFIMSPASLVKDGTTLVPLRFISEAFGCEVRWDSKEKAATVILVDHVIKIPIGKKTALVNDERKTLEVAAQLINGNTYIPFRFIGESLGAQVNFDAHTKEISIEISTYQNPDFGFQTVLPAGWRIFSEDENGIAMFKDDVTVVIFSDEEFVATTGTEFELMSGRFFSEFIGEEDFEYYIYPPDLAEGSFFDEDGYNRFILKWSYDELIYACLILLPFNSYDQAVCTQAILMINTLEPYIEQNPEPIKKALV